MAWLVRYGRNNMVLEDWAMDQISAANTAIVPNRADPSYWHTETGRRKRNGKKAAGAHLPTPWFLSLRNTQIEPTTVLVFGRLDGRSPVLQVNSLFGETKMS